MIHQYSKYLSSLIPVLKTVKTSTTDLCFSIPANKILPIFFFLKNHTNTQYKILSDLCVIDYPFRKNRFDIVYNLLSIRYNSRLRIKIILNERNTISSIISVYKSANWWERESWDMFGVFFKNHPDLRRILSDYGFEGHPLRKDFPLTGYTEVRYSEIKKRVIYEPITISQNYRFFNFKNVWN